MGYSDPHSLSDNLKSRDASASKKERDIDKAPKKILQFLLPRLIPNSHISSVEG